MATTAINAWRSAERTLFNWFQSTLLDAELDVQAFSPDEGLPRTANVVGDNLEMWTFEISGGGEAKRTQTAPMSCWHMNGMWRGIFDERERAQYIVGLLMENLPVTRATNALLGIEYMTPLENPTITRTVIELANDLTSGGEVRVWVVEYPLDCFFFNVAIGE